MAWHGTAQHSTSSPTRRHIDSVGIVFIESIVTDPEMIQKSMEWKVQNSRDFAGTTMTEAMNDLALRVAHYVKVYKTVQEHEGPYIKMFDLRAKVMSR